MALTNTTLAAAKSASDTFLKVAASTGFGAGYLVRIGEESYIVSKGYVSGSTTVPIGLEKGGTIAIDHASGAQVTVGTQVDWATQTTAQTNSQFPIAGRARVIREYSADGEIALPPAGADLLVVLSGTAHTGLTLAAPTKDLNGCRITILDLTAAAHVVTLGAGIGGGALVTLTFDASGRGAISFWAYNEIWYLEAPSGTFTGIDVAIT